MSDYTVLTQNENGETKYLVRKAGYTGGGSSGTMIDAYTKTETNNLLSKKQDKLTAGENITIIDNVISSTGGGVSDAYTKAETNTLLSDLQNQIPDVSNLATKQFAKDAGFPSAKYDDLTLGASPSSYIAPANGWFYVQKVSGQAYGWIYINTPSVSYPAEAYNKDVHVCCIAPILKGQKADIGYNLTGATMKFRFVYAEGENGNV